MGIRQCILPECLCSEERGCLSQDEGRGFLSAWRTGPADARWFYRLQLLIGHNGWCHCRAPTNTTFGSLYANTKQQDMKNAHVSMRKEEKRKTNPMNSQFNWKVPIGETNHSNKNNLLQKLKTNSFGWAHHVNSDLKLSNWRWTINNEEKEIKAYKEKK